MSWVEELSRAMAADVIEVAAKYKGASLQLHQFAVVEATANLRTVEETIAHFESGEEFNPWTPAEERALNRDRRRLAMKAVAHLLMYWVALGREEKMEDVEERTGTHGNVREDT